MGTRRAVRGWGTFPRAGSPAPGLASSRGSLRRSKERNAGCSAQACSAELLQLEMFIIAARRMPPQTHFASQPERAAITTLISAEQSGKVLHFQTGSVWIGTLLGPALSPGFSRRDAPRQSAFPCPSPRPPTTSDRIAHRQFLGIGCSCPFPAVQSSQPSR